MKFLALELAFELVRLVHPLIAVIARYDRELATQMSDALTSSPLNLGEGRRREGKDRLHFYRTSAGSTDEVATGLRVAECRRYLSLADVEPALGVADRLLGMLWSLTHPRR